MSSQSEVVLTVSNLKKKIKNKWIIKGVSFDVKAGEIFGFLGPNGSGKTTTIRMLVDLIRPTDGKVEICGYDVQNNHNKALQYVGCIVENPELYSFMSGWDNLEHFARMIPGIKEKRIHEVVAIVGLDARIHDKVKTYSLGMRQRLGIAQALLGNPKLLILDEPTNGLDPQGIKEMREFIRELAKGGLSLFVSSHLLSEIQQLCDRVAIISHGEVIHVGEVEQLLAEAGNRVIWRLSPYEEALQILKQFDGVTIVEDAGQQQIGEWAEQDGTCEIVTQLNQELVPLINKRLTLEGIQVYGITTKNPTLEDLFLSMTEGEKIE